MSSSVITDTSNRKVAVIGVGYVGASIAYALTIKGLAREIVLIERLEDKDKCVAEINDIRHGIPFMGSSNIVFGSYSDIKDCDLIIISAGRNRRAGENRIELAEDNLQTILNISKEIKKYYTKGVILVVTNPVDVTTRALTEWLELPAGTVFGSGCLLDCSRFTNVLADYLKLSSDVINAYVIGEHGDGQIPLWSKVTVAGISIDEYCNMSNLDLSPETRTMMEQKVLSMGMEIIKGKGRTHFGIASCVCYVADSILNRRSTIVSVSSVLSGEYGISGIALSLPSIVGSNGIERCLTEKLADTEFSKLKETAEKLSKVKIKHI